MTIKIEWKLPIKELERNNQREVLLQYRWIKEKLNRYELEEKDWRK